MAKKKTSMRDRLREKTKEALDNREKGGGGGTKFNFPEGADVQFFKPKKGNMKLDILPYETADGDFAWERTYYLHNSVGSEDRPYVCLKSVKKPCPICEARAELMKTHGWEDDLVKDLKPKQRQLFNVIDLGDEDAGVQLFDVSYHNFGKMLMEELEEDDDLLGFPSLDGGSTLKVRFKEETFNNNKFYDASRIDFEERDDYEEGILEEVLNLDEILNIVPYEKLEAIFLEKDTVDDSSDDEEDEQEEEPKKKPARKSSRKKKEEPEEEEQEEDDEEEEKPKRRARKGRKKKAEPEPEADEEEDDEDEEEEEPEEKPKRRSRRASKKADAEKPKKRGRKAKKEEEEEEEDDEEEGADEEAASGECPHGHTFGADCDETDECFECDVWDDCKEAQEASTKKKRKKK